MMTEMLVMFSGQLLLAGIFTLAERRLASLTGPATIAELGRFLCLASAGVLTASLVGALVETRSSIGIGVLLLSVIVLLYVAPRSLTTRVRDVPYPAAITGLMLGLVAAGLPHLMWPWGRL